MPKEQQVTFFSTKEARCITENVYHEARGEPYIGQVLVARVTLNRGADICSIVYAKNQFSWTATKKKVKDKQAYYKAHIAAHEAITHDADYKFFHAYYVKPRWARRKGDKVGNHIFYK